MRFSKRHKNRICKDDLYIVTDVKAQELKNLDIPYQIYKNGYNYGFLITRKHLPKLIELVEPRFKEYWQEQINKEMNNENEAEE